MPSYVYGHVDEKGCDLGAEFEVEQPITDEPLSTCPRCGRPIRRLISPPMSIRSTRSDGDLRNMGFTKLVRRDKGVYENVTASDGEGRIIDAGKPETLPDIRKKIGD